MYLLQLASALALIGSIQSPTKLPTVVPNDNRVAAGAVHDGVLSLELRAGVGIWRPGGQDGPALTVQAFGQGSSPLSSPAPMIRVPEGTQLEVTVRNDLADPLRVG